VLAVSVFYKYFDDPIERIISLGPSNPLGSYRNADLAHNVGAEFELRKNLQFMWKRLRDVSVGLNFAYVHSLVRLRETCDVAVDPTCDPNVAIDVSTSRVRPLQGQSPFVVNAYVDYDDDKRGTGVRLLYNGVLRNIAYVGAHPLPDVYQEAIHQLDFVGRQRLYEGLSLTLQVQNMMNWPVRGTIGPERRLTYLAYPGASFLVGLVYRL
jgi:outer membrane receptor protein involved in Fe transport